MIRVAVFLAAIAQMPLAAAVAEAPAVDRASDSQLRATDGSSAAAAIWISQPANQTCAPARGPLDLGSMEEAIRSASSNISWNDLAPSRSMWASFEYMAVWVKGSHVPSPVTSSQPTTPLLQESMSWQNSGTVLSGDQHLDAGMHSGGRITAGAWLKDGISVEASFFSVQPQTSHFSTTVGAGPR